MSRKNSGENGRQYMDVRIYDLTHWQRCPSWGTRRCSIGTCEYTKKRRNEKKYIEIIVLLNQSWWFAMVKVKVTLGEQPAKKFGQPWTLDELSVL